MGSIDTKDINATTTATLDELPQVEENTAVKPSVYDDADLAQFFEPIDGFEGKHLVDHSATWTEREEKKVVRTIDTYILPWCCLMFMAMQLDRSNISWEALPYFHENLCDSLYEHISMCSVN